MNKKQKYIYVLLLTFLCAGIIKASAQKIDAFARVSVSPREGVVRQPYKVTINVYSSTWFAAPLQFANLRIDNAFIIPFTRTVSSINYINRKKYATLSFYYLVFPYNTGTLQVPELEISASIPPEGGYKGEPVTIRTNVQTIKIKPVPASKEQKVWMVANNINIKESWSRSLNNLKVGDVVEREIEINAEETLPSLIQPLEIEKPDGISIYPKQADLRDTRNNQNVNGKRIEYYSYLFEEEGEIMIPAEEVLWWNPHTKRIYQRTLAEQKISIAANPELALMESLKDSLLAISAPKLTEVEEKTIRWVTIGVFLLLLIVTIYYGRKLLKLLIQHQKEKYAAYLQSEDYHFKKIVQALKNKTATEFIRALYCWFDKTRQPGYKAAISYYLTSEQKHLLESIITTQEQKITEIQQKDLVKLLTNLRTKVTCSDVEQQEKHKLNPV
ncbi:BatD family protein [uncultured Draconibacterium sp.]|uniref:BatD family protein n=1 Tax=uncultured Draconibacterium sp. TaxID=1573823 RepID=UPI0032617B04